MLALLCSDCWARSGQAANLLWPVPLACVDKRDSRFSKSDTLADGLPCQGSSWPPTCRCRMRSRFGSLGFLSVLDKPESKLGFRVGLPQAPQSSGSRETGRGKRGACLWLATLRISRVPCTFKVSFRPVFFFSEIFKWTLKEIPHF